MQLIISIFLILLLAFSLAYAEGNKAIGKKRLTLTEAIHFALEHSPQIDTSNKTLTIRESEHKSAFAKLFPSLDFGAAAGIRNSFSFFQNDRRFVANNSAPLHGDLNLAITQNLYDNGGSLAQLSIAANKRQLALLESAKVKAALITDVAVEFYAYSRLCSFLKLKQRQVELLEKQSKILFKQYEQRLKSKVDFMRFQSQLQRANIEKNTAQKSINLSAAVLAKLLGSEIYDFEPVLFSKGQRVTQLLPETPVLLENTYDYQISQIQREINAKVVGLTRRKYWPRLALTAGLGYSNSSYLNPDVPFSRGNQLSYHVLLKLDYNLWDWGILRREVQIAQLNEGVQNNELRLNLLEARSKIDGLLIDVSRVRENYVLAQKLLRIEEQNYQNIETLYHNGKSSYLDLISSLNNLINAQQQFYETYFETLQLLAKTRFYEGVINNEYSICFDQFGVACKSHK
jgi:outer membrane protein TolC